MGTDIVGKHAQRHIEVCSAKETFGLTTRNEVYEILLKGRDTKSWFPVCVHLA